MSDFESFIARAYLQQGVVLDTRFGMGLDGLLASAIREKEKRRLGISGSELDGGLNPSVGQKISIIELPLSRCNLGSQWHWSTTCAQPLDLAGQPIPFALPDSHSIMHQIHNEGITEVAGKLPKTIPLNSGRWRRRRTIVPVTITPMVQWRGFGDIEEIRLILKDTHSIGNRRHTGEGTVIRWEFLPSDNNELSTGHLHENKVLGRPCFRECLDALIPIEERYNIQQMRVGFRPPYWHMDNQEEMFIEMEGIHAI